MKYLPTIAIILSLLAIMSVAFLYFDVRQFKCDTVEGVFAERKYTYPILREIGYNPDDYGKDTLNPLTTSSRYNTNCN